MIWTVVIFMSNWVTPCRYVLDRLTGSGCMEGTYLRLTVGFMKCVIKYLKFISYEYILALTLLLNIRVVHNFHFTSFGARYCAIFKYVNYFVVRQV